MLKRRLDRRVRVLRLVDAKFQESPEDNKAVADMLIAEIDASFVDGVEEAARIISPMKSGTNSLAAQTAYQSAHNSLVWLAQRTRKFNEYWTSEKVAERNAASSNFDHSRSSDPVEPESLL